MKLAPISILIALLLAQVSVFADGSNVVHVALVFDDGPFTNHTPKLCELFAKEKVHVSFSFIATNVQVHPDTAKAVLAGGHEINNHSYSHRHPKDLDDATLEHEIVDAQKIITEATGVAPKWYWCPFLESDDRVRATAAKAGIEVYSLKQVVVSQDYDRSVGAEDIKRKATTNVKDGSVILFHEWRDETYEQMPAILAGLRMQGCEFLTFSELAAYVGPKKESGSQHKNPAVGARSGQGERKEIATNYEQTNEIAPIDWEAGDKDNEERYRNPHPSDWPLPNFQTGPGPPLPDYVNFFVMNDGFPSYLRCEYAVREKPYNQSNELEWFKAALEQIRTSGPEKFPPINWIAVAIRNVAEHKGASTFEQSFKVGAIFKAADVFDTSHDVSQMVAHAEMDRHPFLLDQQQPSPGEQQRWIIVERHAATNHVMTGTN